MDKSSTPNFAWSSSACLPSSHSDDGIMAFLHVIALACMLGTVVQGLSFSGFSSQLNPTSVSDERNTDTDMTADDEDRLYGGSNADFKKYPYMAGIQNGPYGEGVCGGALIAPQYVLTAANCFDLNNLTDLHVSLGSRYTSGRGTKTSEQIRVVEIFQHPLYNKSLLAYDVGLVKLEKPATHQPAKLCAADGSDNTPGTMATVVGWGLLYELSGANYESTSPSNDATWLPTSMCAGRQDGKDVCGDSGDPLIANDVVVGVVSGELGDECGDVPGSYTRVAKVLPFIHQVLNEGSSGNITD
ncbi:unnamed protein product [Phytophthora lilii]|uniref:Unnamed protein product n=1 Tax=Phytophthora lilii TaxID=2077276 RepID=A0A9W6XBQ4_9STRA|nr:unnamed protein product [Phytophthora lilii]